jgi:hypothetical protein
MSILYDILSSWVRLCSSTDANTTWSWARNIVFIQIHPIWKGIVACMPLIRRVLVRMIGFINSWLRTHSLITLTHWQYNTISLSQFTVHHCGPLPPRTSFGCYRELIYRCCALLYSHSLDSNWNWLHNRYIASAPTTQKTLLYSWLPPTTQKTPLYCWLASTAQRTSHTGCYSCVATNCRRDVFISALCSAATLFTVACVTPETSGKHSYFYCCERVSRFLHFNSSRMGQTRQNIIRNKYRGFNLMELIWQYTIQYIFRLMKTNFSDIGIQESK